MFAKVRCAVPATVVRLKLPNVWLAKSNAPSPPVLFLTTVSAPRLTLVKVQVTFSPAATLMLAGLLPLEQVAPIKSQPVVAVSLAL